MRNLDSILEEGFFRRIQRPGRYAGGELHTNKPREDDLQVALVFPDLYEIGFPYLGFQILYYLLNKMEGVSCQRVYAPSEDAERILRSENIPLFTLEGRNPLSCLDIIGFTLQYELHASAVLNMLELGGITLLAERRGDDEPLVLGGGPLSYNPEPFAPFFDVFLVGDGEEYFPKLVEKIRCYQSLGLKRREIIPRLSEVPGVYVPSLYRPHYSGTGGFTHLEKRAAFAPDSVQAVHTSSLHTEHYSAKPLVPLISVEHDRLTVEVMRGCSRGCRFCNAGMIHRPIREASVQEVLDLLRKALSATGYEEISLLSLSTADYSQLTALLLKSAEILEDPGLSLSYPSLRPDAFTKEMVDSVSGGRKTSLTFAPEAGSERLRSIINKDLRDEDLFGALEIASEAGWRSVKLYFIVGLPGERVEDVEKIVELAKRCQVILGSSRKKPLRVSLAVFSPKPHSPFQRAGMTAREEVKRRIDIVRRGLGNPRFKVSFHHPEMAMVETLIARGDRRLGRVIERVHRAGGRLEGWSDRFDFSRWDDAMKAEGLNWDTFIGELPEDAAVPWSHIRTGIKDEFFAKEWDRAQAGEMTPDCRWKCAQCGIGCPPPPKPQKNYKPFTRNRRLETVVPKARVRFKFARTGQAKYISHLETAKLVERGLRRAGTPLAYSQGFHPHPRISFGPALPLGYETRGDYFDVVLTEPVCDMKGRLNEAFHGGFEVIDEAMIPLSAGSLSSLINYLSYEIRLSEVNPAIFSLIDAVKSGEPLVVSDRKGREWEISEHIQRIEFEGEVLKFDVLIIEGKHPRPEMILRKAGYASWDGSICRFGCFKFTGGELIDPLMVG